MVSKSAAVGMIICSVVILVLSFTAWGSFETNVGPPQMQVGPLGWPHGNIRMRVNAIVSGWNGNIGLAGVSWPNYMPVLGAIVVGILGVAHAATAWRPPAAIPIILSALGVVHLGLFLAIIGARGNLAAGSIFTFLAFIALGFFSVKAAIAKPQPSAESADTQ